MLPPHYDITIILTKALVNNLSTQTVFVVVVCLFVFLATFFFSHVSGGFCFTWPMKFQELYDPGLTCQMLVTPLHNPWNKLVK